MKPYFHTLGFNNLDVYTDDICTHLEECAVRNPTDLGFLARTSGDVSTGLVCLGCPEGWTATHFSILEQAIRVQAANRQGVVGLALLELASPTGGRMASAPAGAPPAVAKASALPPSAVPDGRLPCAPAGGVCASSGALSASASASAVLTGLNPAPFGLALLLPLRSARCMQRWLSRRRSSTSLTRSTSTCARSASTLSMQCSSMSCTGPL